MPGLTELRLKQVYTHFKPVYFSLQVCFHGLILVVEIWNQVCVEHNTYCVRNQWYNFTEIYIY